jgi:polyisoprenoid-binding protein YceI
MRSKLTIVLCFALGVAAQTGKIAPGGGSRIEATVEKTGLMSGKKHTLIWERFSGQFSPKSVTLEVEAASVKVLDDWIGDGKKEHVRKETIGKDVLHAEKFPRIQFASTAIAGNIEGTFEIAGALTIRGITKPVTLSARKLSNGSYDAETTFPMSAFGIKPPTAALGAIGTKDAMTLRVKVVP